MTSNNEQQHNIEVEALDDGSFAPTSGEVLRDAKTGRWLPGTAQPLPNHLRSNNRTRAYRTAIQKQVPPERIAGWLDEAAEWAREYRSPRAMVAVVNVALQYGIGKPRQQEADNDERPALADLLQRIDDAVTVRAVDVEVRATDGDGDGAAE